RALSSIDGRGAISDLGLSLLRQPNIFAGELFRSLEIVGRVAYLGEPGGRGPSWLLNHRGHPVECVGRRLVMLICRQSVFLMAGEKRVNTVGGGASRLELGIQLLKALDLFFSLRPGDRNVLDCFGETLPQGRPVGTRLGRSKQDLLSVLLCFRQARSGPIP